jgi:hypothetical protein
LPLKDLQSRRNQQQSLFRPTHTVTIVACSNSQLLKRRQLAHGARNRADQLIVVQVPASRRKQQQLSSDHRKLITPVPTHMIASDDSWPTVLGIVPVS